MFLARISAANKTVTVLKKFFEKNLFLFSSSSFQQVSTTTETKKRFCESDWATVVADNGVVVSWHPAQPHPYEHSKPIPRDEAALREGDTVLKIQLEDKYKQRYFSKRGPSDFDLQNMFYTNKHEWYPRPLESRLRLTVQKRPIYRRGL